MLSQSIMFTLTIFSTNLLRILESIYLIECYRVLLIQRPPNIYPPLSILDADDTYGWALPAISKDDMSAEMDQESPYPFNDAPTASLSSIVILSWHIIPRGFMALGEQSIWSPGLIEVALDQWNRSLPKDDNISRVSLYLLVNIAIHANLSLIQKFAYGTLNQSSGNSSSSHISEYIRDWTRREECQVAIWHAVTLLERATVDFLNQREQTADILDSPEDFRDSPGKTCLPECPQLVYGIYFACLVIWSYTSVGGSNDSRLASSIGSGKAVLRVLRVRVAHVLLGILAKLQEHSS